jgi:hypothetical protein
MYLFPEVISDTPATNDQQHQSVSLELTDFEKEKISQIILEALKIKNEFDLEWTSGCSVVVKDGGIFLDDYASLIYIYLPDQWATDPGNIQFYIANRECLDIRVYYDWTYEILNADDYIGGITGVFDGCFAEE